MLPATDFKSWTWQFAFHFVLMLLKKAWIHHFSGYRRKLQALKKYRPRQLIFCIYIYIYIYIRCITKVRLRVKVIDWPSMSPDLNPIEHLWGILKRKVEVCKVSNMCQLRDIVMEERKRIPVATCEALVNSIPRRVKAVLDNDGGHTKYW